MVLRYKAVVYVFQKSFTWRTKEMPEEGAWSALLREATTRSAPAPRTVVVVGDDQAGKKSLWLALQQADKKGSTVHTAPLLYGMMEVDCNDADESKHRMGMWLVNSGVASSNEFLAYPLNAQNLANSMVVLCVDLSAPWTIASALSKWTKLIRDHIKSLISGEELDNLRDENESRVRSFREDPSEVKTAVDTPPDGAAEQEVEKLPLPEGVLSSSEALQSLFPELAGSDDCNLGIPMLVVGCKSDLLENVESSADLEVVQYALRTFCLAHGAGLVYCSTRSGANVTAVSHAIHHMLWASPPLPEPQVVERFALVVPSGWDSVQNISIISDKPAKSLAEAIPDPSGSKSSAAALAVAAEDDADDKAVLLEIQEALAKDASATRFSSVSKKVASSIDAPPDKEAPKPAAPVTAGATAGGDAKGAGGGQVDDQKLTDYFQSLISKPAARGDKKKK